jgi:hypothetical protein
MKTKKNIKMCKALIPQGKKGATAITMGTIVTLGIVGLAGFGVYKLATSDNKLAIGGGSSGDDQVTLNVASNCPDDLTTTFTADGLNNLNEGSTNYTVETFYLVPEGDFARATSYATSASASRTTGVNLDCGDDYEVFGVATQDSVGSFGPLNLGAIDGGQVSKQFDIQRSSDLKMTAYDNIGRAFVYDSGDASNSDFENVAMTWKSTTDNATATAMTASSILDWDFTVQAQTANTQFGDVNTILVVDADKTDYAEPSVWYNGQKLAESISSMNSDDRAVVSSYEYAFVLPEPLSDSPNTIRLVVPPKSGINPDVDVKMRFLAESHYLAVDGKTIKTNVFKDSDSSEIYTSTANTVTIDIS